MKKGREEGIEEGLQKGREEGKREEKIEMARSMIGDKQPVENIMKWTGLSKPEVEALLPLRQEP